MSIQIKCPKCGKKTHFAGNEFRPFCSERCKVSDLGAWAAEAYFIRGEDAVVEEELNYLSEETDGNQTYH